MLRNMRFLALAVLAALLALIPQAQAATRTLPISPQCRGAQVPEGNWVGVRRTIRPLNMRGLRDFYDKTVRQQGNIFGSDYCTFERRLVFANPIGANGKPVNDRMTNLKGELWIPVKPEYATAWMCFEAKGACANRPALEKSGALPDGQPLWRVSIEKEQAKSTPPAPAQTAASAITPASAEPALRAQIQQLKEENEALRNQMRSLNPML